MIAHFEYFFSLSLAIGCLAVFLRAAIYHFFEDRFGGIRFPGRYVLPTRRVVISEVSDPWIRISLYVLNTILVVVYTVMAICIIIILIWG